MSHRLLQLIFIAFISASPAWSEAPSKPPAEAPSQKPSRPSPPIEAFGISLPASSCGTDSVELARQLLPEGFKRHSNAKHVIFTDASWDSLIQTRTALRRAWAEYRGFARRLGVPLQKPDEKLACIVFNDRADFIDFSRRTLGDLVMLEHAGGYYSNRFNWIVFYEPEHQEMVDNEHRRLDEYQRHLDGSRRKTDLDALDSDTADRIEEAWSRQQDFIDESRREIASWARSSRTRITVHEAIHQFTHPCDAPQRYTNWPIWLDEGLATSFETSDATLGFGPDKLSIHRDEPFKAIVHSNQLVPLREFIRIDGYGKADQASLHVFYAQAYGLLTWLYEYRTPQLAAFLKHLEGEPEEGSRHDVESVFEQHFGDIEKLESRWHRIERTDWRDKRHN